MTDEFLRWREFAKAMADHVLGYKNVYVSLAVMDAEGKPYEFRGNLACTRPRLNCPCFRGALSFNLLKKLEINVGTFLE